MKKTLNIFELAFNHSIIPTWITDVKGYLKVANKSFYDFLGMPKKENFN